MECGAKAGIVRPGPMKTGYLYVVDQSIFELFGSRRSRDREELLCIFQFLAKDSSTKGDFFLNADNPCTAIKR